MSHKPKGGVFKECLRSIGRTRAGMEVTCRELLPFAFVPCLTCVCVTIKVMIVQLIEPLIIPVVCIGSLITVILRLFCCAHGKDCVYSTLEWWEIFDSDAIGVFWEVDWWRIHEKKEQTPLAV